MQIIFLTLISILLVSCSKGNTDSWQAPTLHFMRASQGKNTVLTSTEILELNDYIYFSSTSSKNPSIEEIKNEKNNYTISADTECVSNGKFFKAQNVFIKTHIVIKEILPINALLNSQELISCKMAISIQNAEGSTKKYLVREKTINLKNFTSDIKINNTVLHSELGATTISNLKVGDQLVLTCDLFSTNLKNIEATTINLDHLLVNRRQIVQDFDYTQYKPHQKCRLSNQSGNIKYLSQEFEIQFQKLIPKYSYSIFRGHSGKRSGNRLYIYDLNLTNPSEFPISFGLNKNSLVLPFTRSQHYGSKEHDGERYTAFTATASISNSNPNAVIDKGAIDVIYLLPGESISFQTYYDSQCNNMTCVAPQAQPGHLPIYNLEYNYRTREEIELATDIKLLDQMSAN